MNNYSVVRSKRKTIGISISHAGEVVIRAPHRISEEYIRLVLEKKASWIQKSLEKLSHKKVKVFSFESVMEGSTIPIFGKEYSVAFSSSSSIFLSDEDGVIHIPYIYKDDMATRLLHWYKDVVKKLCTDYLDYYSKKTGYTYRSCSVTSARTRWASCSYTNNINCSWRLLFLPKEIIEYVMVHELAHTQEKNHSKKFWNCVGGILPEYEERKEWLLRHRYTFPM